MSAKKEVVIYPMDNDTFSIYEESGQALEHDFPTEKEAKEYAEDQNCKVVDSFNI
jgi:hypothetical protein